MGFIFIRGSSPPDLSNVGEDLKMLLRDIMGSELSLTLMPLNLLCHRFIRPENVPVQYGGLSRPRDSQNGTPKPAFEFTLKGGEKVNLEIEGIEGGATITWEIVVGGWDLEYTAEFVPSEEGSYTIAIQKPRKIAATEETVHCSFTPKEPGKMVLSIDNTSSRRKKAAAYRYFVRKPSCVMVSQRPSQ